MRDERAHPPGAEPLWHEAWDFTLAADDGTLGAYARLGLYPNLGVAWYWASVVGPARRLVIVVDDEVPLPRRTSLEIRSHQLWADHICEEPFEHWTVMNETYAVALDEPAEALGRMLGDRVPLGFDLGWEAASPPARDASGYTIACRVHGEILVGDERIDVDAGGSYEHRWGVLDWWSSPWRRPDVPAADPVAHAPVRVTGPDGRTSHVWRSLCRIGSTFGWVERNEPQAQPDPGPLGE